MHAITQPHESGRPTVQMTSARAAWRALWAEEVRHSSRANRSHRLPTHPYSHTHAAECGSQLPRTHAADSAGIAGRAGFYESGGPVVMCSV
eukprot:scaffold133845_cov33-Tisochrysis_lutea.AAC.1